MTELTDQDLKDLRVAIESAHAQGSIAELRKIVVHYAILSKKLEDIINERAANGISKEHEASPPNDNLVVPDPTDGNVGGGHVRKRKHSRSRP